jgi:cysteine synthase
MSQTKFLLDESEIPTHWYNIVADMPNRPAPPLGPDGQPIGPDALAAIFPTSLIEQEMSAERWIPIPEKVREIYQLWRPSPLFRAHRLEAALGTPAKIYYKYEGVSPAGSHKVNTSVAQAYYNAEAGIKRIATETGAGQWGCAMSLAGQMFGLEVRVYMVKVSYGQKPYRRSMLQTWGPEVFASPSTETNAGRAALAEDPDNPGSLGLAISEAVEDVASRHDTNYALGSVLNHVLLHQTVIGLEAKKQFEKAGDYPDMIFAPCGSGSNFGGAAFPFFADKVAGKRRGEDAVLQPFGPRPFRYGRLRQLLQRQAGRLRLSGRSDPGRTGPFAEGGVSAPPVLRHVGSGFRHQAARRSERSDGGLPVLQLQLQALLAIEFVGHEGVDGADARRQRVGVEEAHCLERFAVARQFQFHVLFADDALRHDIEGGGEQRGGEALSPDRMVELLGERVTVVGGVEFAVGFDHPL